MLEVTRPDLAASLREIMDATELKLETTGAGELPMTVIHGDFTRWNILFTGGSLTGVLDFDLAHLDSRAADLAMARAAGNREIIEGYRAEAERIDWPLSSDEQDAVVPLDAAMRIGMVGWELYGQQVAGTMNLALIERQVQRLTINVR